MPLTDALFDGRTPRVVAIVPSYIASCQINVVKPLAALHKAGNIKFKHVSEQHASPSLIAWADLIVFCRNTEPCYRHLLSEAIGRRKPVIYDIDDSFWDIPESTDPGLARYHLQPLRLRQLEVYLAYATMVRVYSPLLKLKVARFNENVRMYRSSFDFSQLPKTFQATTKSRREKVGIVYATSRIVDDQYKVFLPALSDFLAEHPHAAQVTIWGCAPSELLTLPAVSARKLVSKYDDFLREFARSGYEIGLAPLVDNEFNRSKNNTKFRDYGACGIAGIYSDVDAYSTSVEDEINGLLVHNSRQAWKHALERLVFDKPLRDSIRKNAREKVFREYRQELIEQQWLEDIRELLADAPSFWLSNARNANTINLRVTAHNDNLSGIEIDNVTPTPAASAKDKIYLEVRSEQGATMRGIASSIANYDTDSGCISFSFQPILHSAEKSFDLRVTGINLRDPHDIGTNSPPVRLQYEPVQ